MSSFIKRYANYLTQKVQSYREMNYDFCRAKRGYVAVRSNHFASVRMQCKKTHFKSRSH